MKSSSPRRSFGFIEPLEARIAPARIIIAGAPDFPTKGDVNYDEAPFVNTETGGDQISLAVGPGVVGANDTFYLRLGAGDVLRIFNSTNGPQDYLTVNSGNAVAFFVDKDLDNEADEGELVSLSLGKDASVTLRTGLEGSVVTNLDEKGTASTADDMLVLNSTISAKQGIKTLALGGGGVGGSIIAGGNITNVTANGPIGAILAGTAGNGQAFDFFPNVPGGDGVISFAATPGVAGSSISRLVVDAIGDTVNGVGRIEAGDGGAGAAGGSLSSIRITEDTDGFSLIAGDGGVAAAGKTKGGFGGSISGVLVAGSPDLSDNSLISMIAGHGGDAANGTGGHGGVVSNVKVGFQLVGSQPFPTADRLVDNLQIESGAGGAGKTGGAGGNVSGVNVLLASPGMLDPLVDELSLVAGNGGASNVANGKAGIGGSLSNLDLQMLQQGASTFLQGGAGGAALATGKGAAGGSITNVGSPQQDGGFLSTDIEILAGNGSSGKTGGAGGKLNNIFIGQSQGITANSAVFNAGTGGNGAAGSAGAGGAISTLRVDNGDFILLNINSGTAANGGNSVGGKAGVGGSVSGLDLVEGDSLGGQAGGDGGDGNKGGAAGGSLKSVIFSAKRLTADVRSGAGGDAAGAGASGKGGAGGLIQNVQIDSVELLDPNDLTSGASATVVAGVGGIGLGTKGVGGAGGGIQSVTVLVSGSGSVTAGNGGSGASGAAGRGGSIVSSGVFADIGAGKLIAGDAGANGAKPGIGGSILGTSSSKLTGLYAATDLTLRAGDGTHGGAGGSIRFTNYGSTSTSLLPTPSGNITVQAGQGSAEGRFAGAGGSIDNLNGSVSSGGDDPTVQTLTLIAAGDAIGTSTAVKSAAGGSITNVSVFLGGAPNAELRLEAGDGGDAGSARIGAKGGDVRSVTVFDIDPGTILRSIAAGDGGNAVAVGGLGGTVQNVEVKDHDIGVRSGENFGYATMGGIFAGAGGTGSAKGRAGSVLNVSASAIAAIVAGRTAVPELVERVEAINLGTTSDQSQGLPVKDLLVKGEGDLDQAEVAGDPSYSAYVAARYATNNLVGAVVDPTRVDANKFVVGISFIDNNNNGQFDLGDAPIDGLIMARSFNQVNSNFTPEARLIGTDFDDYDNDPSR